MKTPTFILVHGIKDTSRKFKTMQAAFENNGYRCITPSLMPNNASKGLEFLAIQLKDIIEAESKGIDADLCLVGFSMGGLVSRYYLQELEGYRTIKQFFSISTPHHGSLLAYLSANKGVKQMRPGSEFLRKLERSSDRLNKLPCYSYWTPFDLMILPASSSIWDKAEDIKVNSLCHPFMVTNEQIIADIIAKAEAVIDSLL
jgi:triacylglycerol lipase